MTLVHSADQGIGSIPTEQAARPVLDWKGAADGLCAEMLKQAPTQARKVADTLYEMLLTDVQAFLRDNVDYNLSADLLRANSNAERANNALRSVAEGMGADTYGFPNYPTPEMIADRCLAIHAEAVERADDTIDGPGSVGGGQLSEVL